MSDDFRILDHGSTANDGGDFNILSISGDSSPAASPSTSPSTSFLPGGGGTSSASNVAAATEEYLKSMVTLLPQGAAKPVIAHGDMVIVVGIDETTRKVSWRPGWLQSLLPGSSLRYYVVRHSPRQITSSRVFSFATSWNIPVEIALWFEIEGFQASQHERLAEGLAARYPGDHQGIIQSPSKAFESMVQAVGSEFMRSLPPNASSLAENGLRQLEMALASEASRRFGLALTAHACYPQFQGVISFSCPTFVTYISNEQVRFRYELGLVQMSSGNDRVYAPVNELRQIAEAEVKDWLAKQLTLNEIHFHREEVRARLEARLVEVFKPHALGVQHFKLHVEFNLAVSVPDLFSHQVACRVQPGETQVAINHQLSIALEDVARFNSTVHPDFRSWISGVLDRCTREKMFGHSYTDLLLSFGSIEDEIREGVAAAAAAGGLRIRQLIAIPDLPISVLVNSGFRLEITRRGRRQGNNAAADGAPQQAGGAAGGNGPATVDTEFEILAVDDAKQKVNGLEESNIAIHSEAKGLPTKDPRVEFPCHIVIEGRLRDLRELRKKLTPDWNWKAEMLRVVNHALESVTRDLAPQDLFTAYATGPDSPEERMKQAIADALEANPPTGFCAECSVIEIAMEESIFSELHDSLTDRPHRVEFEVMPYGEAKETVPFKLTFHITGFARQANAWGRFQSTARQLAKDDIVDEIRKLIEDLCLQNLSTLSGERLRIRNIVEVRTLVNEVIRSAERAVANAFGLAISFVSFRREASTLEKLQDPVEVLRLDMWREKVRLLGERIKSLQVEQMKYRGSQFPGDKEEYERISGVLKELMEDLENLDSVSRPLGLPGSAGQSSSTSDFKLLGNEN